MRPHWLLLAANVRKPSFVESFVSAKKKGAATHATFGPHASGWGTSERPFNEMVSSYRRKSVTLKLQLRTKFLSDVKNYHNL